MCCSKTASTPQLEICTPKCKGQSLLHPPGHVVVQFNAQLSQCDSLLLLKGEALLLPACSHLVPCSSLYQLWHFSDPSWSCDQVNEIFESACAQSFCFWDEEQEPSPQTPPSSWYRKPFSLRWEEAGWLRVGAWCDAGEAEVWDVAQDLICADQNIPRQSTGILHYTEPDSAWCRDAVLTQ